VGASVALDRASPGVVARRRHHGAESQVVIETRPCGTVTPKMIDLGGAKIPNAVIRPVFWGAEWATEPNAAALMNNIAAVVAGPYFGRLGQYGVRRPLLEGRGPLLVARDCSPRPGESEAAEFVADLLRRESLRGPDEYYAEVPVLLFPPPSPDAPSQPDRESWGGHGWISRSTPRRGAGRETRIHYAWIENRDVESMTSTFCRVMLGLLTDPEGDGWRDLSAPTQCGEISDLCRYATLRSEGIDYPFYWSELDRAGIVPVGQSSTSELTCIRTVEAERDARPSTVTHFGGYRRTGPADGQPFVYRQSELIALRDQGERFFTRDTRGRASNLRIHLYFPPGEEVFGTRCLACAPDGWRDPRILNLPDCA